MATLPPRVLDETSTADSPAAEQDRTALLFALFHQQPAQHGIALFVMAPSAALESSLGLSPR